MIAPDLAELIGQITSTPVGTVTGRVRALRAGRALTLGGRGRFGVAEMASADASTLLLATVADHPYGSDPAANVRRVRSIPLRDKTVIVEKFADELAFTRTATFGAALDALIEDMRSGAWARFENALPSPVNLGVRIDFENLDAGILLSRERSTWGAGDWFFRDDAPHTQRIFRHTMIRGSVFQELAEALGPPT